MHLVTVKLGKSKLLDGYAKLVTVSLREGHGYEFLHMHVMHGGVSLGIEGHVASRNCTVGTVKEQFSTVKVRYC